MTDTTEVDPSKEAPRRGFGPFGVAEVRQVVALGRSVLDRPHSPQGDPDPQRGLVEGLEPFGEPLPPAMLDQMRPLMSFRSDFFDKQVMDALDAGISQVVNVGTGYDDRALRFRKEGVSYIDLDLPTVIADKESRLARMGADTSRYALAGIDLETDDVGALLDRLGHDPSKPTLFICEHVFVFLTESTNDRLYAELFRRSAEGSRVVATVEASKEGLDREEVLAASNAMFGGQAPLKTVRPRADWLARLRAAGWTVEFPETVVAIDHTDKMETQLVAATR